MGAGARTLRTSPITLLAQPYRRDQSAYSDTSQGSTSVQSDSSNLTVNSGSRLTMDRNDTRHLLAELEFDGPSAAEVAAHKAERFAGQVPTRKSQRERDREAAAKKAKEEEEAAAKA